MKYLLVFLLMPVFYLKAKSVDIQFLIQDMYTHEVLSNVDVELRDSKGTYVKTSNDKGIVLFERVRQGEVWLRVINSDDQYGDYKQYITTRKYHSKELITIDLFPSDNQEDLILLSDDEQYGLEKDVFDTMSSEIDESGVTEAMYPGGTAGFQKYIGDNVHYPQLSIEGNEQGRVYLSFIVEKDGAVSHVRIVKGTSPLLDAEAIRLIRVSSRWIPATYHDESVRSKVVIPINFTLF